MTSRWSIVAAFPLVMACEQQRSFASADWKAEAGTIEYETDRKQMVRDVQRQFPKGTQKAVILAQLGSPDEYPSELCTERRHTDCLVYVIGSTGVDPDYFVLAFENDRLVSSWRRAT